MDVIKASNASDFLGLVPALLGFTPTRSIVAIPFEGNRTIGAARFDLNPDHDPVALLTELRVAVAMLNPQDDPEVLINDLDDVQAKLDAFRATL